jgi:hypothetical protein
VFWAPAQHWLAVHVGVGTSPRALYWYSFWSGFGSDIGEVAIIGGMVHFARHANCGQKGCWRFGRHNWTDAKGVVHKLCRKHHPVVDGQITGAQIAEQHAARV